MSGLCLVCVFVQQLKVKHDQSVSLNVNLQHEVDRIPAMKKQLEAYRAAKADAVSGRQLLLCYVDDLTVVDVPTGIRMY